MVDDTIQKHEEFIKVTTQYIKECLKNKVSPHTILESFSKIIDETVNEELAKATHS